NSTTVTLAVNDFTVSTTPASQTVSAGGGTNYTVTIGNNNGFSGTVALTAAGLPTGATAVFNPTSINSLGSSTLTVSTTPSTPAGTNNLTITGTSGSLSHNATVTLIVTPAADFSISAAPGSQTVTAGNGTSYTATITALNGFGGNVTLTAGGLPSGATAAFNPTSVTGSGSSTVTITTSTGTPAGTNTLTLTGTSGSLVHNATVTLIVTPAADFSISAAPGSQTVTAGNGTSYTATITALNGFGGNVTLTAGGLPSGATAAFNPTSVTGSGSSTVTITTSTGTPAGTNTLTLTGTSGSLVHNTTVTLIVNAASSGLPAGWTDKDIGSVGLAGSGSYSSGVFTVKGSGSDIWRIRDQRPHHHRPRRHPAKRQRLVQVRRHAPRLHRHQLRLRRPLRHTQQRRQHAIPLRHRLQCRRPRPHQRPRGPVLGPARALGQHLHRLQFR